MSGPESESIFIKAASSHNAMTSILIGSGLVLTGAFMCVVLPKLFFLPGVFIISGGIVGLIIGFFKLKEPKHSLELTREHIIYYHRCGKWRISWENIQRIDVPRITKGIEQVDLEMIGFKLRDADIFLDEISPRLITYLLMEQRPLTMQNRAHNAATGRSYGADMIEDEKFLRTSGETIKGVSAMFGHRMGKLRNQLGYDIFISTNEIDREATKFIALLKDCQDSATKPKT
ncbi:DUF2982 domain-containing protein [Brumicola pallidula]|jgi:hypothetical protein|uniref:DUF2982 domain-containing protein n=1 Tax=Brumicola pallidula DSM 14239 = ACAM 615 TaxID=1121922 RepID=K6ZEF7_9ALTE|nr:DUF2982 domain-containing protein [Glaciecola pallidula]GAC28742.1 hypothetical protein GPAL_1881 [Glaciecola pallidula DSM 14239 = ACAM 615]